MAADRTPGVDHDHYDWSPIISRPKFTWPDGNYLALSVMVVLEHLEWAPPEGAISNRRLPGGFGPLPYPDYIKHTHREYGHRVGVFRLLDLLEHHGIPPMVAIDVATVDRYPWLADHCHERGCELVAHGVSLSQMISSRMDEATERTHIRAGIDAVTRVTGTPPQGWFGIEYNESVRTPQLLAEHGIGYVCDWVNDEQPYPMNTPHGELTSLPILLDADDAYTMGTRRVPIDRYADLLVEAAEVMAGDAASTGSARHLLVLLHPWLSGQPFRVRSLTEAFARIVAIPGVWPATGTSIVDHYRTIVTS